MNKNAKVISLPLLVLTETCTSKASGAMLTNIHIPGTSNHEKYYRKPIKIPRKLPTEEDVYCYNYFPLILNGDGSPWKEANLYILSKLKSNLTPSVSTYLSIASDLVAFKRYIEKEDINPFELPKRKLLRPTYRYRNSLIFKVQANEISPVTAQRRIGSVIAFYRWLLDKSIIKADRKLWEDKDKYLLINDHYGASKFQKIKSTDLTIPNPKNKNPYSDKIEDGGKLRPLSQSEQISVLNAVTKTRNIEMMLIHLLALFTGARLQTILTLRVSHFRIDLPDNLEEIRLTAGYGTKIDTKYNKQIVLILPRWLHEKIRAYTYTERARKRRSKHTTKNNDAYLFITNRGTPFYDSKLSLHTFNLNNKKRYQRNGASVRQFIQKQVIPLVRKERGDINFRYKAHDLRASYGMNLTDIKLEQVSLGLCNLHQAREFVKMMMGHESSSTTDRYLNYRHDTKMIRQLQANYETHIESLTKLAMVGLNE